jgi:hypothetical protein
MTAYKPGDYVVKRPGGTEFIGEVVSAYTLPDGGQRLDIRCIAPGARNLIHIYRPDQLRPATGFELDRIERMLAIWSPQP